jgi:IclR family mhp operon transcriptional activator
MSPGLKMDERGAVDLKDRLARISEAGFCVKGCMNNEANRSASIAKPVLVDGKVVAVVTLIYFQAAMKEETAVATYLAPLSAAVREIEAELAAEMVN